MIVHFFKAKFLKSGNKWFSESSYKNRPVDAGKLFFRWRAQQGGISERKTMIDHHAKLSISRQADLLNISRVVSITCLGVCRTFPI